ncbi:MAG: hypothetical protein GY864_05570 [Desulfobacterales bacterium]|nr:hypothetical protein [Desulfobacterales bacterium]
MKSDSNTSSWEYFDKIYCISLDERTDRRKEAKEQFRKVGLDGRVEHIIVKKHPLNSEQGIFESHLACIKKGMDADARNILIFEDDIIFKRYSPIRFKRVIDFLRTHTDWDAFFLGGFVKKSVRTGIKSVAKVDYRCCTHAYILNRNFAEMLLKESWKGTAFDDLMSSLGNTFYAVYPAFAFQSNSSSDNNSLILVDRIRRMLGGIAHVQRMNELFNRYKAAVIILHVLLVLLLCYGLFNIS